VDSDESEKDVLYSQLLQLAHDAPRSIERVEVAAESRTAVAFLRDGGRLRANFPREDSVLDLERLLARAGVELRRDE
jgi:hypothetical protein